MLPPDYAMILGALIASGALWSIERRQDGRPIHAIAVHADVPLLTSGATMVLLGAMKLVA